jgi:shikimate kinase
MGCGKTTLGELLARKMGIPFIDTDRYIEERNGISIKDMFSIHGEKYFRDKEKEALRDIAQKDGYIVSCGGGIVLDPENIGIMKRSGKIIWLKRDPLETASTVDTSSRPLLNDIGDFMKIYNEREKIYCGSCDMIVENTGKDADAVAEEMLERLDLP